jgi:hypothetical protein
MTAGTYLMKADDFFNSNIQTQLRSLDKLIISDNATVRDLLEQAMVAASITSDPDEEHKLGPLEVMYHEIQLLKSQLADMPRTSGYWINSPTTDNTAGWYGNPYQDPLRNYPDGYAWDDYSKCVIRTTNRTGT